MSKIIGRSQFKFEKSTLKVSFLWTFDDHTFPEYMEFNKLCKTGICATEEIRFQSGFLGFTDHYVQCYITDEDYGMYIKVCLGEPDLPEEFTSFQLSPPKVTRSFDGGVLAPAIALTDPLKAQLIAKRYFTDEDFEAKKSFTLYWFYLGNNCAAGTTTQVLKTYLGNEITLDFEFDYCFWNKVKKSMHVSAIEDGEDRKLEVPTRKANAVLSTKKFLLSQKYSDFIIKCQGETFQAHRMIIAEKSPVFAAMLEQPMKESKEGRLVIDDFSPEVVEQFLRFIYTGKANVAEYAMDLYKLGHKYEISDLKDLTEVSLMEQLNASNLADINELGKLYSCGKLMDKCYSFFKLKRSSLLKGATNLDKFSDFMLKFALE